MYFAEEYEPRGRRAFLPLIAESGIDNMGHRLVQIGVVIDDHRVLAAHLTDHSFDMRLSGTMRVRFAQNFQTHFARAGKCNQMNLRRAHQMGADFAAALEQPTSIVRQSRVMENFAKMHSP